MCWEFRWLCAYVCIITQGEVTGPENSTNLSFLTTEVIIFEVFIVGSSII